MQKNVLLSSSFADLTRVYGEAKQSKDEEAQNEVVIQKNGFIRHIQAQVINPFNKAINRHPKMEMYDGTLTDDDVQVESVNGQPQVAVRLYITHQFRKDDNLIHAIMKADNDLNEKPYHIRAVKIQDLGRHGAGEPATVIALLDPTIYRDLAEGEEEITADQGVPEEFDDEFPEEGDDTMTSADAKTDTPNPATITGTDEAARAEALRTGGPAKAADAGDAISAAQTSPNQPTQGEIDAAKEQEAKELEFQRVKKENEARLIAASPNGGKILTDDEARAKLEAEGKSFDESKSAATGAADSKETLDNVTKGVAGGAAKDAGASTTAANQPSPEELNEQSQFKDGEDSSGNKRGSDAADPTSQAPAAAPRNAPKRPGK